MAFDFSKLNFYSRLSARGRVLVLFGAVIGLVIIVYMGTRYFLGTSSTVGPSRVATAPAGLQSVPGGQVTSAYYTALQQANLQKQQQARMTGTSAIPTMINTGQTVTTTANCNIICSDQTANVKDLLDDWVRSGKINPDVAQALQDLANKNVPVSEYAAYLDSLVKSGKLTPEQARELLEQYKKQHANALLQDSAKTMDDLIKSGQLPLDAANELLAAQKRGVTPAEYADILNRLVKEGKISPETAARLLAQYSQQLAKQAGEENQATIADMARKGEITSDVAKQLSDLANRNVPVDAYEQALQNLVAQGKLTPAAAAKLLDAYKRTQMGLNANGEIDKLIAAAEGSAQAELVQLLKDKLITPDVAKVISDMIAQNVSIEDFTNAINQMVQQKQLSPEIGPLKIQDYTLIKRLRDQKARLVALQVARATPAAYEEELRKAVTAGILTPDQAAQMLADYRALTTAPTVAATTGVGNEAFANLQQRLQEGAPTPPGAPTAQFTAEQLRAQQDAAQSRQDRINAMMTAMQNQAGTLIAAWAPPNMLHREGSRTTTTTTVATGDGGTGAGGSTTTTTTTVSTGAPLIKAGTIIFGVLDTEANSDYPDSPIMVTIVEGPYKGAKLLGRLMATKGVAGQLNRLALTFQTMNLDSWDRSKTVNAFAIDPDTARSVMASSVNNHYLVKYGSLFAASLLQGYSQAIQSSASTTTTGIFGTSTTHPELNPSSKIMVALGQVGQNFGSIVQNWTNIPPTVRINAGVSLGILFMSDVAAS